MTAIRFGTNFILGFTMAKSHQATVTEAVTEQLGGRGLVSLQDGTEIFVGSSAKMNFLQVATGEGTQPCDDFVRSALMTAIQNAGLQVAVTRDTTHAGSVYLSEAPNGEIQIEIADVTRIQGAEGHSENFFNTKTGELKHSAMIV